MAKRLNRFIGEECRVYRKDGNLLAKGILRKVGLPTMFYAIFLPKDWEEKENIHQFIIGNITFLQLKKRKIKIFEVSGKKLKLLGKQNRKCDTRGWFIEK